MLTNLLPSPNLETLDEQHLLSKAQEYLRIREAKGKPEVAFISAWDEFFMRENARLQGFLSKTKAPQSERDDVLQEVRIEILQKLSGFQGDHAVRQLHHWMYKLIRSKAALLIRRRVARPTSGSTVLS